LSDFLPGLDDKGENNEESEGTTALNVANWGKRKKTQ